MISRVNKKLLVVIGHTADLHNFTSFGRIPEPLDLVNHIYDENSFGLVTSIDVWGATILWSIEPTNPMINWVPVLTPQLNNNNKYKTYVTI